MLGVGPLKPLLDQLLFFSLSQLSAMLHFYIFFTVTFMAIALMYLLTFCSPYRGPPAQGFLIVLISTVHLTNARVKHPFHL